MSFNQSEINKLLAQCHRRCCLCHKFCGVKMELHHAELESKGGSDDIENAVPLCFECHAEVALYNPDHPKGRKFTAEEVLEHKRQWLDICKNNPQALMSAPRNQEIGPLEGMLLELEFNLSVVRFLTKGENWKENIGCALNSDQHAKAISEGALMLLPLEVLASVSRAYFSIGRVNTFNSMFIATRPEGNAFAEAQNKLLRAVEGSEKAIIDARKALKDFLSFDK